MYIKAVTEEEDSAEALVYETVNERWEIGFALSRSGFRQTSFVNRIATTKGGRHVDYITSQIVEVVKCAVEKKQDKRQKLTTTKPFQVNIR